MRKAPLPSAIFSFAFSSRRRLLVQLGALLVSSFILHPSSFTRGQNEEQPPAPQRTGMRITFLPPPMEGSLSLGIYDKKGKLVRTLVREGTPKDFIVGLNGLITFWDGKDDTGKLLPPGLYAARGYSVGEVQVDGIALHGNDWITDDDAPRPARLMDLRAAGDDKVTAILRTLDGKEVDRTLGFDTDPKGNSGDGASVSVMEGKVKLNVGGTPRDFSLDANEVAIDAALGAPDRLWVIVRGATGTEVRAYTYGGEFLRRLAYAAGEPVPQRIFAARGHFPAKWSEEIMLLETNDRMQRVRSLALPEKATTGDAPSWVTVMEKELWRGETFDSIRDLLKRPGGKPFAPDKEFVVHLVENPLIKNEPTTAHVNIGFNDGGSFIQTTEGLPLRRITETPGLKWVVIGREGSGRQLTVFQSDGAVVEEFKAHKLANMMAFDAGEYEWKGEGK